MPATKTSRTRLDTNTIAQILVDRYGVGPLAADPITIEWAVTQALKTYSVGDVKTALRRLNKARNNMGKISAVMPYGHPLF